jgi:hypothetical protein
MVPGLLALMAVLLGGMFLGYLLARAMKGMPRRSQALVIAVQWLSLVVMMLFVLRQHPDSQARLVLGALWLLVSCTAMPPVMVYFGRRPTT